METVADELSTNEEKDCSPLSSPLLFQSPPSSEDLTTNPVLQFSCSNTSEQYQLLPTTPHLHLPHQSETVQIQDESVYEIHQPTIIPSSTSYSPGTPPPLPPPIIPSNMNTTPSHPLLKRYMYLVL